MAENSRVDSCRIIRAGGVEDEKEGQITWLTEKTGHGTNFGVVEEREWPEGFDSYCERIGNEDGSNLELWRGDDGGWLVRATIGISGYELYDCDDMRTAMVIVREFLPFIEAEERLRREKDFFEHTFKDCFRGKRGRCVVCQLLEAIER